MILSIGWSRGPQCGWVDDCEGRTTRIDSRVRGMQASWGRSWGGGSAVSMESCSRLAS